MIGRTDLGEEWIRMEKGQSVRFGCPAPPHAKGFMPCGFRKQNDSTADWVGWYGLSVILKGCRRPCQEAEATVWFADGGKLSARAKTLSADGTAELELPFSMFPVEAAKENRWEFAAGVEIVCSDPDAHVEKCVARRKNGLWLHFPVQGKSARPDDTVEYEGEVINCTDEPLLITAEQAFEGWESLIARIEMGGGQEPPILLQPGASADLRVFLTVHDNMVPGGNEAVRIRVWGRGAAMTVQDTAELLTMRYLPHPYLYHDRAGWEKVKEHIGSYEPYRAAFQQYLDAADSWVVEDPMEGYDFCYETKTENSLMSAAYAYAVTGKAAYAEKLADFYRRFSDPEKGYPARKKGCSQSYVQEGHFFKHLAVGLDMIYESEELDEETRSRMEQCFRIYMEMLDTHVRSGEISNWLLSELSGALYGAMVLQDAERIRRFAFGNGGIIPQFCHGVFNDGWWFECSVGYNTWVASMMLHAADALRRFGYDIANTGFPVSFGSEVGSVYAGQPARVTSGMYNRKWGGNRRNMVHIRDMFDAALPFLDYRGVLFGISDSDEKKLTGEHFGSTYDLAYAYYHDDQYLPVIAGLPPDPVFGDPQVHKKALRLSESDGERRLDTAAFADNIGLALLRSSKEKRPPREQIQAVLRYGSHGYAHGHFDIGELLSVMRYGRSFFNPEHCWWGYGHFMYKFYVQCSLTKNMVVVDEKMQVPADSRRILWDERPGFAAAGIAVKTAWSYPPYGGMVYYQDGQTADKEELRLRCRRNGCFLPILEGEGSPVYGEMTGFTEEILQKRIMAVTDDYIVLFDYLEGEKEHQYESLLQIKGFLGIEGESVRLMGHTEQMNDNPISDAQFITDCSWYEVNGPSLARFCTEFTEEQAGASHVCDRSSYNEPGLLKMDVYTAWPKRTVQMTGRVAVHTGWAADGNGYTIPLAYRAEADGRVLEKGEFDGWILGRGEIDAEIRGASVITLSVRQGVMHDEIGREVKTPQGIFWGEIRLVLEDGMEIDLGKYLKKEESLQIRKAVPEEAGRPDEETAGFSENRIRMENTDTGCGIGRDYRGGRVTIVGMEYPYALGASPIDHEQESRIIIDIRNLPVVRLKACVGVDAFPGDERQQRKTYAVRSHGRIGRYVTVIEPYEDRAAVARVTADSPDQVRVELADGRVQTITLLGIERERPSIRMSEDGR